MAHNGGLITINPIDGFAFLNKFLEGGLGTSPRNYLEGLNAAGFPTVNPPAGYQYKFGFTQHHTNLRPGGYVLKWDGRMSGSMLYGGSFNNLSGGTGRFTFTGRTANYPTDSSQIPDPQNTLTISAIGSPGPTNIRICHVDDEALLDAGGIWQPGWLQTLIDAKPGCLRFLDVFAGSSRALLSSADFAQVGDMMFDTPPSDPAEWATGTVTYDAGTDTYTIPKTGFTLTHNAAVKVRFPASSGATPKANVNGTGAKGIVFKDGYNSFQSRRPYFNTTSTSANYLIGSVGRLWYDRIMDKYMMDGGSSENTLPGSGRGWPLAYIADLCNRVGAHCWINVPYTGVYPDTGIPDAICDYFRDHLDPGLKLKLEYSNETWNTRKGFWVSGYSFWHEKSLYPAKYPQNTWMGLGPSDEWTGRCTAMIGRAAERSFGAQNKGIKYDIQVGFQTSGNSYRGSGRIFSGNFASEVADQMYPGSPAGAPAKNYITNCVFANYYASWIKTPVGESYTAGSTSYSTRAHMQWPLVCYYVDLWNLGDDNDKAVAERWVTDGCLTDTVNGFTTNKAVIPSLISDFAPAALYFTGADGSGLDFGFEFYEGGNSNDFLKDVGNPIINYAAAGPDGVVRPATLGVQTGNYSADNVDNLLRAFRWDPKMRWVGYYLLRKLAATSNRTRLLSRYQHQSGSAWGMYNPNWTTTLGNVAPTSLKPNLAGIDEDGKAFQDFSYGRVVFYGKTT